MSDNNKIAADLVSAYVSNNTVPIAEFTALLKSTLAILNGSAPAEVEAVAAPSEKTLAKVSVKKSVTPDPVTGFPATRVLGQAGMLDTARFSYFVAEKLGVPVGSVQTLTLGSHRRHHGPGPVRLHGGRQAAGQPARPGRDRRTGGPDPQRRGRDRRPAEDRVRVLRPVGGRGPDGPRGRRGLRPGAAGLRLGGRRVRHLRGLPGGRGRDRFVRRPFRGASGTSPTRKWPTLREAAEAVRAKQADVASL